MENREEFEKLKNLVEETKAKNGKEDLQKAAPQLGYDPAKKYKWEPSSQFLLAGEEFGIVLNAIRAVLSTQEAQKILVLEKASKAIDNALARAIQVGVAQEEVETKKAR